MKKRFRDRKDARRVDNITGMAQICIDLKPNRCDSDVYINQKVDVTNLVKYVEKKKKEGYEISYFHAFVAAIGKAIYNRPKLNRFVTNRHIFEHNDVVISFVAKISFDDKSEEIMVMVPIKEDDTLFDIYSINKEGDSVEGLSMFDKNPKIITCDYNQEIKDLSLPNDYHI